MGYQYAVISFLAFICIDKKISHHLLKTTSTYKSLSKKHQQVCNERFTSSVHAVVITLSSIYVITFDDVIKKELVWGYSEMAYLTVAITTGYLVYDMVPLLTNFFNETEDGSIRYALHHLAAIYGYGFALQNRCLLYLGNLRLIAEMSTPFVNLRWILHLTGKKDTKLYIYNGLLMTGTFFFSRILVMPYFYHMAFKIVALEEYASIGFITHCSWIGMCLILDGLNIYWFSKIMKGVLKFFSEKKSTENGIDALAVQETTRKENSLIERTNLNAECKDYLNNSNHSSKTSFLQSSNKDLSSKKDD